MSPPVHLVIDASVAIKWVREEVHSAWARSLPRAGVTMLAPSFLLTECANVLWRVVRRREITGPEGDVIFRQLLQTPVELVVPDHALHRAAFSLATRLDHPVYDCLYLALALSRGAALATADARFARTLRRAGALPEALILTPPEAASPPA